MAFPPLSEWPLVKQLKHRDLAGMGETAFSKRTLELQPRTRHGAQQVKSICPYCAVGCGQSVWVKDGKITDIEGDLDSPISRGRLCPKGAATFQLVTGSHRAKTVLYRKPHGTEWEELPLERAMEMVAQRVKQTRDAHWEAKNEEGKPLNRTLAMAHLGGATLDNEENYLIKKLLCGGLGMVWIENQARI